MTLPLPKEGNTMRKFHYHYQAELEQVEKELSKAKYLENITDCTIPIEKKKLTDLQEEFKRQNKDILERIKSHKQIVNHYYNKRTQMRSKIGNLKKKIPYIKRMIETRSPENIMAQEL